jgi:hypothetical protein
MAMFIVKPWYKNKVNPDDYFDPVTHIATEENFIKFLECGVYDSKYIGYKVQLSNSAAYDNGLWIIADVNHDSVNTGQTNCYDLISEKIFLSGSFGSNWNYVGSYLQSRLNSTLYNGFSLDIKNHIMNIVYKSQSSWVNTDKVVAPSFVEVNGSSSGQSTSEIEGVQYPLFTDNNSRRKMVHGASYNSGWWLRTRALGADNIVWQVNGSGTIDGYWYYNSGYTSAIIRTQ